MKIIRNPGLPRGFAFSPDRASEIQLRPVSRTGSSAELFLPTDKGVAVIVAEIAEIRGWASDTDPALLSIIGDLIESAKHPQASFAGHDLSEPVIMGVVNVTPDSFHDGGRFKDADIAIGHGNALIQAGAEILDIGGESTRPGADPVSVQEEIDRVLPVIEQLSGQGASISVDTRRVEVMRAALDNGASIVNDVTGLSAPGAIELIRDAGASAVLMHMQGQPRTMQSKPLYDHAPYEVATYLVGRIAACEQLELSRDRIAVDPGIGFGKSDSHNFAILNSLSMLHGMGVPIVLGVSRKSFIGRTAGADSTDDRLPGTIAATLHAVNQGVQIHRVHDVAEIKQALRIWQMCEHDID